MAILFCAFRFCLPLDFVVCYGVRFCRVFVIFKKKIFLCYVDFVLCYQTIFCYGHFSLGCGDIINMIFYSLFFFSVLQWTALH